MIRCLHVSNLALIREITLELESGLNLLTGETGTGKSILVDALAFGLWGRAGTDLIRSGAERASVQVEFFVGANPAATAFLAAVLRREVTDRGDIVARGEELGADLSSGGAVVVVRTHHYAPAEEDWRARVLAASERAARATSAGALAAMFDAPPEGTGRADAKDLRVFGQQIAESRTHFSGHVEEVLALVFSQGFDPLEDVLLGLLAEAAHPAQAAVGAGLFEPFQTVDAELFANRSDLF